MQTPSQDSDLRNTSSPTSTSQQQSSSNATTNESATAPGVHDLNALLDSAQIMGLLRQLPMFEKSGLNAKDDLALSYPPAQQLSPTDRALFALRAANTASSSTTSNEPGPSSHPRGPPNLGQLSAVAMQQASSSSVVVPSSSSPGASRSPQAKESDDAGSDPDDGPQVTQVTATTGRSRISRNATMGSEEWTRQRKDNHKEVERRRRSNINDGINELGRIVPNGTGEKAKGAILSRAVQYIHHLKENEARNIEKWTLEKLLMDQAMGDLQGQLEDMRRAWDEERAARARVDRELEVLRGLGAAEGKKESAVKRKDGEAAEGEQRAGKKSRVD